MSVRTMGGEWSTSKYDIIKSGANEVGVDIDLRFMPDARPLTSHHSHEVCYTMGGLDKKIAELEAKAKLDADPNIAFEILALKQERDKRIAAGEGKK